MSRITAAAIAALLSILLVGCSNMTTGGVQDQGALAQTHAPGEGGGGGNGGSGSSGGGGAGGGVGGHM